MTGVAGLRDRLDPATFADRCGLEPDDWQRDVLRSRSSRILLLASRQSGKSTVSAVKALHTALYQPKSLTLILAPAERQAKETFQKISAAYRELGHAPAPDSDRALGMELPNGSRVEALPGTHKTIRGFSGPSLLIVDEASRIDDSLYHALRPMLATTGGALLMLSSPAGKRGVFYEEYTGGVGWERYEVKAEDCPRISPEFLEEERQTLPHRVFRQEYECEFVELEDVVFSTEAVDSAITTDVQPLFGGTAA